MDCIDGQLLRAMGNCLQITADRFRALLNTALRNGFKTNCAQIRIFTSRYVWSGKGQKSRTLFTRDSPEAEAVVSMDAVSVLIGLDRHPSLGRHLGCRRGMVTFTKPHCPRRTLYAMVAPHSAPLRFWPPRAPPTSLMVLFAPMPGGCMHKFVSPLAAKHTAAEKWLERLWRHMDVSALMLVCQYDKQVIQSACTSNSLLLTVGVGVMSPMCYCRRQVAWSALMLNKCPQRLMLCFSNS